MSVVIVVSKANQCIGSVRDVKIGTAPDQRRQHHAYRKDKYVASDVWLLDTNPSLNDTRTYFKDALMPFIQFYNERSL